MKYPTIESAIGKTPLVALQRIGAQGNAQRGNVILGKLEGNNPAGSVKDRPALSMIQRAQERGEIKPGDTLIEATSGNTGIALAMAAAIKGYRMVLIMPEDLSIERAQTMKAFGAELILTPENVAILEPKSDALRAQAEPWEGNSLVGAFSALAREVKAWLLAGSLPIKAPSGKVFNRSVMFNDEGAPVAFYDKIHLFDVDLPSGERYRESSTFEAGSCAVVAETPWGKLGFSVCYDVRFPHLYRQLAQAGARYLVVPAAFTQTTGEAHWHVLLRARAIENGCYVLAAAQGGRHDSGRETYGHSLAVSPWGEIIGEAGVEPGIALVEIDPEQASIARRRIPSLDHDRPIAIAGGELESTPSDC